MLRNGGRITCLYHYAFVYHTSAPVFRLIYIFFFFWHHFA